MNELRAFAAELRAAGDVQPEVEKVLFKGAMNIKKDLQEKMRASTHFKGAAGAISFDIRGLSAEIGPTKGSPGSLANLAYFGGTGWGGKHSGGTVEDPEEALLREVPAFEKHLTEIAVRSLE